MWWWLLQYLLWDSLTQTTCSVFRFRYYTKSISPLLAFKILEHSKVKSSSWLEAHSLLSFNRPLQLETWKTFFPFFEFVYFLQPVSGLKDWAKIFYLLKMCLLLCFYVSMCVWVCFSTLFVNTVCHSAGKSQQTEFISTSAHNCIVIIFK